MHEATPQACRKCGGEMRPGSAIENTYTGSPDFPGGDVVTISPGGPGRLVDCMKCAACGWSVTGGAETLPDPPAETIFLAPRKW